MRIVNVFGMTLVAGLVAACATPPGQHAASLPPTGSSTTCEPSRGPHSAAVGNGPYGCHFRLHHPDTHQVLANTAYSLAVYAQPEIGGVERKAILEYSGVTDGQGRSVYVRTAAPIPPAHLYFVQRIGTGPYHATPQVRRGTDLVPIPGVYYTASGCGEPYVSVTDEQGNGVEVHAEDPRCLPSVKFYWDREHRQEVEGLPRSG